MQVLVWVTAGTWPAVVAAATSRPSDDEVILIAVDDPADTPDGALLGLMGRGHRVDEHDSDLGAAEARALLEQAAQALGRPCQTRLLRGPTERVVTTAAEAADWLILARDGDRSRLGPHSLGKRARFIIDHAPCTVEVLWPEAAPGLGTIPPPPPAHS